ncbi:MAG TPA: hypothetical protein VN851_07235 [Thermoanaerobaculia bacterium]|nr:hypothetical protein [Thermoanaerobaculia bacterium]
MKTIRAVAFQSGDYWMAQCLEHNLAALAVRLEDLPSELSRVLTLHVEASRQNGVEPFTGFPPAPRRFWKMYESSRSQVTPIFGTVRQNELLEIDTRIAA